MISSPDLILPYHDFQKQKYIRFNKDYLAGDIAPHSAKELAAVKKRLEDFELYDCISFFFIIKILTQFCFGYAETVQHTQHFILAGYTLGLDA